MQANLPFLIRRQAFVRQLRFLPSTERAFIASTVAKDEVCVMNEFGQKGKVALSERLAVSPEEASALTGIGLTSIRGAISSGDLKAKKHGRRTIILPDDLRVWLKALPGAGKPIEQSPAHVDING